MSTINISMTTSDGRSIEIRHELPRSESGINELAGTIKELNKAIDTFKEDVMPGDSKPEENFIHYNRNCKHCKAKNSVTVITWHTGGSGKDTEQAQEKRLYCSKCQRTWPCTSKASSTATHDEKLIHSIQVIFKNARDKMYEDARPGLPGDIARLSEVETKIIERIVYGQGEDHETNQFQGT